MPASTTPVILLYKNLTEAGDASAQPSDWSIHLQDSILIGQDSGQIVDHKS